MFIPKSYKIYFPDTNWPAVSTWMFSSKHRPTLCNGPAKDLAVTWELISLVLVWLVACLPAAELEIGV